MSLSRSWCPLKHRVPREKTGLLTEMADLGPGAVTTARKLWASPEGREAGCLFPGAGYRDIGTGSGVGPGALFQEGLGVGECRQTWDAHENCHVEDGHVGFVLLFPVHVRKFPDKIKTQELAQRRPHELKTGHLSSENTNDRVWLKLTAGGRLGGSVG